jgi:hypothetical protein
MKKPSRRSLPARSAARPAAVHSSTAPFSPALIGLCGIVIGLCFVVLGYAFVRDSTPRTTAMQPSPSIVADTTR